MRTACTAVVSAAVLATLLFLPACSDDDPATPGGNAPPDFDLASQIAYAPPAALEAVDDPRAQDLVSRLTAIVSMADMADYLEPPPGEASAKAGPWERTWTITEGDAVHAFRLTIADQADHYVWTLRVSGNDGVYVLEDALLYRAARAKDRTWGWFEAYAVAMGPLMGDGELLHRWTWRVDAGVLTWEMVTPYGEHDQRTVLTGNADGSGTLEHYEGTAEAWTLRLRFTWTADGAGTWTEYDAGGGETGSGAWGGGGGGDGPVVPENMQGTWHVETVQRDCSSGQITEQSAEDQVLCAGDPMFDDDDPGFMPCEFTETGAASFHAECEDVVSYGGCEATYHISYDMEYTGTTMTMTGQMTITYVGDCGGMEDACENVTGSATRTGPAPPGSCDVPTDKAALARMLAGRVVRPHP